LRPNHCWCSNFDFVFFCYQTMVDFDPSNLKLLPYDFALKGQDDKAALIPVHKALLVTASGFFQKNLHLLTDNDILRIVEFSNHDLRMLINFLYGVNKFVIPDVTSVQQFLTYKDLFDFFEVPLMDYIGSYTEQPIPIDIVRHLEEMGVISIDEARYYYSRLELTVVTPKGTVKYK